jgi:hypothetical protein
MTIMLMALPLGMILGIATWLYRSARRVEDELTIPSRKPAEHSATLLRLPRPIASVATDLQTLPH